MVSPPKTTDIAALRRIMSDLRDPQAGCPWDVVQTFQTIAPYTVEEAYEVADAIERGAVGELADELGDLLLQVVYHSQIAQEGGFFDFDDVVAAICAKMVRRHPHVYGQDSAGSRADLAKGFWEDAKARERARPGTSASQADEGALAGVARALPALSRAAKLQKRAARVGFDWPASPPVFAKVREELGEVEAEVEAGQSEATFEELGDLLFACANLARHLGVDPEAALSAANVKFVRRFEAIEAELATNGRRPQDATLDEMEAIWKAVKAREGSSSER